MNCAASSIILGYSISLDRFIKAYMWNSLMKNNYRFGLSKSIAGDSISVCNAANMILAGWSLAEIGTASAEMQGMVLS